MQIYSSPNRSSRYNPLRTTTSMTIKIHKPQIKSYKQGKKTTTKVKFYIEYYDFILNDKPSTKFVFVNPPH